MQQFRSLEVLHIDLNDGQPTLKTPNQLHQILRSLPNPSRLRIFSTSMIVSRRSESLQASALDPFEALDEILGEDDGFRAIEVVSISLWLAFPPIVVVKEKMPRLVARNILEIIA